MPGRKRVPGEVDPGDKIDAKTYQFIADQLRETAHAVVACSVHTGPGMTYADMRKGYLKFATVWKRALALRSRVEGLMLSMGGGIPEGHKLDLERRMALALDRHGIDPYDLEKLADDMAHLAEGRLEALRKPRRRKT